MDNVNFDQAMYGYDIYFANGLDPRGDPGFRRGKIFYTDCDGDHKVNYMYRDFVSLRNDLRCSATMTSKTFKTSESYGFEATSTFRTKFSFEFSFSFEFAINIPLLFSGENGLFCWQNIFFVKCSSCHLFYVDFGVDIEASSRFSTERNGTYNSAAKSLASSESEVVISEGRCFTHDIAVGRFARSRFTPDFVYALHAINATLDSPDIQDRINVFTRFVTHFGIAYISRAELGASLKYQRIFNSRSSSREAENSRRDCQSQSSETCISLRVIVFGVRAGGKTCVRQASDQCLGRSSSEISEDATSNEQMSVISTGSRPHQSLSDWLESDFKPVPVLVEVDVITNLMTQRNVAKDIRYGFPEALNATRLRGFFNQFNGIYCEQVLGLSSAECSATLTGDYTYLMMIFKFQAEGSSSTLDVSLCSRMRQEMGLWLQPSVH
jgi:hypothetical protein